MLNEHISLTPEITFRSWLWLFVGMIVAELGVLLPALAPGQELDFSHLGVKSLYAQWINILALASLCVLEPWLLRLPRLLTWLLAWLIVIAVAGMLASFVTALDQALLWGLTDQSWPDHRLAGRTMLMTAILAGVVLRYLALHHQLQEGMRAQERARFQALQARIHPHFLFNSLNSIAALTIEQPEQAESAIENLSDLLRGTLRDPDQTISLEEELELCRNYLNIEALRFGPRLEVCWEVADDVPLTQLVPPLILQPLVENAIIHGIQTLAQGGKIDVKLSVTDGYVQIDVVNPVNTEPNRSATKTKSLQKHRQSGIAQNNLRGRLQLRYAGAARMQTRLEHDHYHAQMLLPLEH